MFKRTSRTLSVEKTSGKSNAVIVGVKRCQKIVLTNFIERDVQDKKFVQIVIYKRLTQLEILGLWNVFVVVMLQLDFAQHV